VAETFELELNCAHCGGPLTVQVEDWVEEREPLVWSAVDCPFCRRPVTLESAGRILWAVPRFPLQTAQALAH